jgi:cytochrome c oxidase subunit 2
MLSRLGISRVRVSQARRLALLGGIPAATALASSTDEHSIGNIFKPLTTAGQQERDVAILALIVCSVIFIVVAGLIVYTMIRYRRRSADDHEEPPQVYGSNQIEAAWTVIPLLIVFVLIMVSARVVAGVQDAKVPANALHATVIGHQWWWEIKYPTLGIISANELHVPVAGTDNQATFIKLESADVIHSFWIPQLEGKTDVIPNRDNEIWMDPQQPGTYLGNCAEYCGTQHANMLLRVVVHPKDEFKQWVAAQQLPAVEDASAAAGKQVYESLSCVNCHTVRGTASAGKFGPDLTHLMSRKTIGSGVTRNTPQDLKAWLRDPQAIKPGCLMPDMQLTDTELDAVVSYLVTLK